MTVANSFVIFAGFGCKLPAFDYCTSIATLNKHFDNGQAKVITWVALGIHGFSLTIQSLDVRIQF